MRLTVMSRRSGLLLGPDKVAAAILLIALFRRLHAEGLFLAEADGGEAIGGNTQRDQILLDSAGAAISQSEVVFRGATFITVAVDCGANGGIFAKEIRRLAESVARIGTNVSFVEVKVGVVNVAGKQFVDRGFLSCGRGSGHRDSGGGAGGAPGGAGGNRVGSRGRRRNFRGTLRVDRADVRSDGQLRRISRSPAQRGRVALFHSARTGLECD